MATIPRQMVGLPSSPSFRYKALNPAYQSDPRRILGQSLMTQGASSAPVATPLQGLGRLSSALVGAYLQKGAMDRQVAREGEYKDQLSNAINSMNLPPNSPINALGMFNQEAALNAAVNRQTALDARKPTETFPTLTKEQADAEGLDTSRGQVYQKGTISNTIKSIGGTSSGSLGSKYNQLQRAIELKNRPALTGPEQQELNGLAKILAQETRINTVNKQTGDTESILIPGLKLDDILSGVETETNSEDKDDTAIVTKQAKLSTQESKFVSNLSSASGDIKEVIDKLFNGNLNGDVNRTLVTSLNVPFGSTVSGDAQIITNALNNLADLTTRDRSGATAPIEERQFFFSQILPNLTDTSDTVRFKIKRLINSLNTNISSFAGGRVIKGLPDIKISNYIKKESKTDSNKSNLINLPD